jgi:hypothetical protein
VSSGTTGSLIPSAPLAETRDETRRHTASLTRIVQTLVIGTALFAMINWIEATNEGRGVGGFVSVLAWSFLSIYLRGPVGIAAALGAWTGVVAIAMSLAVGIEPFKFDASTTYLVGPWSFVTWPAVGALVCGAIALVHLKSLLARIAAWVMITAAGLPVAFGASFVTAGWLN